MSRLCLYYTRERERDRWVRGDRYVRPFVRRIVRGRPRLSGLDKVFHNLRLGLDRLGVPYLVNEPFRHLRADDRVGVLGRGRTCLDGYRTSNPVVAGVGLMTHPSEWPSLCEDSPVARYLQHSPWALDVYRPYYGDRCALWAAGIDTETWRPNTQEREPFDVLIYDKIMWDRGPGDPPLLSRVTAELRRQGVSYHVVRYGQYDPAAYRALLGRCRAMVFLCEHESQGIAYQEAMSSGVPILAWDPGWCLDPNRFAWGQPSIPASSVPFFDERCGMTFRNADDFAAVFPSFWGQVGARAYDPRAYVLDHLTLEKSASHFLEIVEEVWR